MKRKGGRSTVRARARAMTGGEVFGRILRNFHILISLHDGGPRAGRKEKEEPTYLIATPHLREETERAATSTT